MKYLSNVTTIELYPEKCTGCGACLSVCPHRLLELHKGKIALKDRDACMECGACKNNCPAGAIDVAAGVGCAAAVIGSMLKKDGSTTCC